MEVWRNFFLGSEMSSSKLPLAGMKIKDMKRIADEELRKMGIVVKDIDQPIGELSGGQRQCVAIARAVYFGAGCSSWTSRPRRWASSSPAWC